MKIKDIIFQIKDITFDEALEYCMKNAVKRGSKTFVVTINPELVMLARNDSEYEKVLKSADLLVSDGVGIIFAGKVFGKRFSGRIHGVDLVEKLSKLASDQPISIGFLGGGKNVAQLTSDCLRSRYPGLRVAFALEEWPESKFARGPVAPFPPAGAHSRFTDSAPAGNPSSRTTPRSANSHKQLAISKMSADILFVAFGSPKQELWIHNNLDQIDTKVAIGVGGAFDFISGKVRRAPIWVRKLGLEWLFRLIIQPWRIKRQIALPKFVLIVLKERFL